MILRVKHFVWLDRAVSGKGWSRRGWGWLRVRAKIRAEQHRKGYIHVVQSIAISFHYSQITIKSHRPLVEFVPCGPVRVAICRCQGCHPTAMYTLFRYSWNNYTLSRRRSSWINTKMKLGPQGPRRFEWSRRWRALSVSCFDSFAGCPCCGLEISQVCYVYVRELP